MIEKAELLERVLTICKQAQKSILASMMLAGVTDEKIADLIQNHNELIRAQKELEAV